MIRKLLEIILCTENRISSIEMGILNRSYRRNNLHGFSSLIRMNILTYSSITSVLANVFHHTIPVVRLGRSSLKGIFRILFSKVSTAISDIKGIPVPVVTSRQSILSTVRWRVREKLILPVGRYTILAIL